MKVLTLDAGGTNFVFSAITDGKRTGTSIRKPSNGDNLDLCLKNIIDGFTELKSQSNSDFDAISFAFPGPADFKNGIIGNLHNLTGLKVECSWGPMLERFSKSRFLSITMVICMLWRGDGRSLTFINLSWWRRAA
jgi:glucokinase